MNSQDIIARPMGFFSKPAELMEYKLLSDQEKIKALENWKNSAIHIQESEYEGMNQSESDQHLKFINETLRKLKNKKDKIF